MRILWFILSWTFLICHTPIHASVAHIPTVSEENVHWITGEYTPQEALFVLQGPLPVAITLQRMSSLDSKEGEIANGWKIVADSFAGEVELTGAKLHIDYLASGKPKKISVLSVDQQKTLSWIELSYTPNQVELLTHTNQRWKLEIDPHSKGISSIHYLDGAEKKFLYKENQLIGYEASQGRYQLVEYDEHSSNKVKRVLTPHGSSHIPVSLATYHYSDKQTTRTLPNDVKTTLHYNEKNHPTRIDLLDARGDVKSTQRFFWNDDNLQQLTRETNDSAPLIQSYTYDQQGNLQSESIAGHLSGRDATPIFIDGQGAIQGNIEQYRKDYVYDDAGRLIQEREESGKITEYIYSSDGLIIRKHLKSHDAPISTWNYSYNEHGILIETTIEDASGETNEWHKERIVLSEDPHSFALPKIIEHYAMEDGQESLHSSQFITYTSQGLPLEKQTYDQEGYCIHVKLAQYDPLGRLIYLSNPGKEEYLSAYDLNGNVIYSHNLLTGEEVSQLYDRQNRLISVQKTVNQHTLVAYRSYNEKGQLEKIIDPLGHETTYEYDTLGFVSQITQPQILDHNDQLVSPTVSMEHNGLGDVIRYIQGGGETLNVKYNSCGKPIQITHPDGKKERFTYNERGLLIEKTNSQTVTEQYEYDCLDRLISTQIFDQNNQLLDASKATYNSFHPSQVWSLSGPTTSWIYDESGKQIEAIIESDEGTFSHSLTPQSSPTDHTSDVPLEEMYHEDDLYTFNKWGQQVWQRKVIDLQGELTITTFDTHHRPSEILVIDPLGQPLKEETFRYNLSDRLILHTINCFDQSPHTSTWSYNDQGLLESKSEFVTSSIAKKTSYKYSSHGLLLEEEKPDGTIIFYTYDSSGRVKEVHSSDRTIHYRYHYSGLDKITSIEDLIHQQTLSRTYNDRGLLTEEKINHLTFRSTYNPEGHRTDLELPDDTHIAYQYGKDHLEAIHRISNGLTLYSFHYLTFNSKGLPTSTSMIGDVGQLHYSYDKKGNISSITSDYWKEEIPSGSFDEQGNLTQLLITTPYTFIDNTFHYDLQNRLIEEKGTFDHSYHFSGLFSKYKKNDEEIVTDDHLQMTSIGSTQLSYDVNGNLTKLQDGSTTNYQYDAWNRLTFSEQEKQFQIHYIYDAFQRRISEKKRVWNGSSWSEWQSLFYLYDEANEIGTINSEGTITELRVLGLGFGAEIGAAVAIELNNKVYAPIHDHRGSISALVDPETRELVESYLYSSFGEENIFNSVGEKITSSAIHNPWRYSSKRKDESTHLIYFGKRYYNPSLGQWITPDPIGSFDCYNPYTFLKNNPQIHQDLYGLFSLRSIWTSFISTIEQTHSFLSYLANRYVVRNPLLRPFKPHIEFIGKVLLGKTLLSLSGYYGGKTYHGIYGLGEMYKKRTFFLYQWNYDLNKHWDQ